MSKLYKVGLINSGAYVGDEIRAEYGALPPAFLPVGNRRLFLSQLETIGYWADDLFITLPSCFNIDSVDMGYLNRFNVKVIRVEASWSIAESCRYALEVISGTLDCKAFSVVMCHGDTYFDMAQPHFDAIVTAKTSDNYDWAEFVGNCNEIVLRQSMQAGCGECLDVAIGVFSFSNGAGYLRSLSITNDFLDSLNYYHNNYKALSQIEIANWFDYGHLSLLYRSRATMLNARHFNSLSYENGMLNKVSEDTKKISFEATWFEGLKPEVSQFVPRYYGRIPCGYQLEYLYLPNLAEIYAYGLLPLYYWKRIVQQAFRTLEKIHVSSLPSDREASKTAKLFVRSTICSKTRNRIESYFEDFVGPGGQVKINGVVIKDFHSVINFLISMVAPEPSFIVHWHGDYFFGNLMFDSRSTKIYCFDPRGTLDGNQYSSFGDWRYDVAKLAHSIVGGYDLIISGMYDVKSSKSGSVPEYLLDIPLNAVQKNMKEEFWSYSVHNQSIDRPDVKAILVLLFLTAIPLHSDDTKRQRALFANGLKLYQEFFL